MTDVLIIGGGPAGLTAAIYGSRAGKSVIVCEKESLGGQITQAHMVRNYPGFAEISGMELGDALCAHAINAGAQLEFTSVQSLERGEDGIFTAVTDDGEIKALSVVFAGGASPRLLGHPRELELLGNGISYCALCDGEFFRDMDVAVAGGGNTAVNDAIFLADVCRSVTLIHRRNEFRADAADTEALRKLPNVNIKTPYTVTDLLGDGSLQAVELTNAQSGEKETISASALFVALGRRPDCTLIGDLADLDDYGYAVSGPDCSTGTPGLFVAGDCRQKEVRQLTTATADGTLAGIGACAYVDRIRPTL